jgi:tetratricopeptide (TPR) repeat protein
VDLAEAIDVAVAAGDLDAVSRAVAALLDTGGVWLWADLGQVPVAMIRGLEAALHVVGPEPTAARARLLLALSTGRYYSGDEARVAALSDEALAVARQLEDPAALVDVLLARANLRWTAETYDEAIGLADEALAFPRLSALQQGAGHTRRAVPLIASGHLAEGNAAFALATTIAERANLIGPLMQLSQHPIARALAEGRIGDAEALVAGAWALRERGDVPIVAESIRLVEVLIGRERGELAPFAEVLEGLMPVLPLRSVHLLLALARLERGDEPAARAALTASSTGLEAPWMRLFGDTVEAEVRAGLPADAAAEELATRLAPHADLVATAGTAYWWGPVGSSLALLEARLGRVAHAVERLREVAERADAWGTTAWAARARARLEGLDARAAQR